MYTFIILLLFQILFVTIAITYTLAVPYQYRRREGSNYGIQPGGGIPAVPGIYRGGTQVDRGYVGQVHDGFWGDGGFAEHPSNFGGRGGQDRDGGPRY